MGYLEILNKWLHNTRESTNINQSFQKIMSELEISDALWIKMRQNKLFIYCHSKDSPHSSLNSLKGLSLVNVDIGSTIEYFGSDYYLSIKYGENDFLISKGDSSVELKNIFLLIYSVLERDEKMGYLENSLKVFQSSIAQVGENYLAHVDNIPEQFIQSVAPVITYTVVHEDWGPAFVASWPPEFNDMKNILFAVNIFSTLDGDQIARLGQVSTSMPTSIPEDGEISSLVFTIQNEKARGNNEVHAISVVLSQRFVNMSKMLIFQLKGLLFSTVEQIRQIMGERHWMLFVGSEEIESPEVKQTFETLLKGLHIQIANLFAIQIGESEVKKWR